MDPEVVIIGADGTEHVFPAGFDPQKAAAIVRGDTGPKPLGPPNQHTATSEEFTPYSFGGLVNNAVSDAKGIIGVIDPRNWAGMVRAKQEGEAETTKELIGPDGKLRPPPPKAYSMPGDRLAAQLADIPNQVYQHPVQSALAVAPFVKPLAGEVGGLGDLASGVASKASAVASHPVTAALGKAAMAAGDVGTLGTVSRVGRLAGRLGDVYGAVKGSAAAPAEAAPAATTGLALEQELIRRMEPDFNTQDVVRWPPKKGILRPDESNQGLMREAVALSKTDQEAAMKVLKALRQRSHVAAGGQ